MNEIETSKQFQAQITYNGVEVSTKAQVRKALRMIFPRFAPEFEIVDGAVLVEFPAETAEQIETANGWDMISRRGANTARLVIEFH